MSSSSPVPARALHHAAAVNVLLVGPVPPPAGGIATSVAGLAAALRRRGAAVQIVDPGRGRVRAAAAIAAATVRRAVVHVHVCGHNRRSFLLVAAARALAPTSPLVVTLHSGILVSYLEGLAPAHRRLVRAVLATASRIVCVSAATADAVVALGLPRARVEVASPFIAEALDATPTAPRADSELTLSMMAAPEPLYGMALVAEAFPQIAAAHPDARLIVFGTGGADARLADALAARGLGDRVAALGELPHASVLDLLRRSHVFLRPTYADGDSMTVREALAVGCRVVASDASARPPGTVLFPTGDARALAGAVERALAEPGQPATESDGLAALVTVYRTLGRTASLTSSG